MSKEIRTVIWCDGLVHIDEQVEAAVTRRFAADTLKECEVDLCEVCDKDLVQPLLAFLAEQGQPVKGARPIKNGLPAVPEPTPSGRAHRTPREVEIKCPIDDCDWEGSRTAGAAHTPKHHGGETLPILEGRFGRRLPDGSRTRLPFPCPSCDASYDSKTGIATHQRVSHP
jgi:hypothetical protein